MDTRECLNVVNNCSVVYIIKGRIMALIVYKSTPVNDYCLTECKIVKEKKVCSCTSN